MQQNRCNERQRDHADAYFHSRGFIETSALIHVGKARLFEVVWMGMAEALQGRKKDQDSLDRIVEVLESFQDNHQVSDWIEYLFMCLDSDVEIAPGLFTRLSKVVTKTQKASEI